MEDKTFLLNSLNLMNGLLGNDQTIIGAAITALNAGTLTADQLSKIKENIISLLDGNSTVPVDLIKSTINQINGLNKNYLLSIIELKSIDFRSPNLKTIVQTKLADKSIIFDNDNDKFNYYYILSNYAIVSRDRTLIQAAITAVQAL